MHAIESTILERLHNCEMLFLIMMLLMRYLIFSSKSNGSEGLFSDHFLSYTHGFYIILSILYTLFLWHGFSPD